MIQMEMNEVGKWRSGSTPYHSLGTSRQGWLSLSLALLYNIVPRMSYFVITTLRLDIVIMHNKVTSKFGNDLMVVRSGHHRSNF